MVMGIFSIHFRQKRFYPYSNENVYFLERIWYNVRKALYQMPKNRLQVGEDMQNLEARKG